MMASSTLPPQSAAEASALVSEALARLEEVFARSAKMAEETIDQLDAERAERDG